MKHASIRIATNALKFHVEYQRSYPGEQIPSLYVRVRPSISFMSQVYVSILEKDSDAADLDFVEVVISNTMIRFPILSYI